MKRRLAEIADELAEVAPLRPLALAQEQLDLIAEFDSLAAASDAGQAEADFVGVAEAYGNRKRISYAPWREVGVPAAVLKAAGISRSSWL